MTTEGLRVRAAQTALVIVDVQERLAAAMPREAFDQTAHNIARLLATAARLKLPTLLSEQYVKGLGATVPVLREAAQRMAPPPVYLEKLAFSVADEPLFQSFLGHGRRTLVMVGMEAHVCVYQSVRALTERGYFVHVPADAVISRTTENKQLGLGLIERAGGVVTSTEAVVFDLLERAGTEDFRALSRLLK